MKNRIALKALSVALIDFQFAQGIGVQVFNEQEVNKEKCEELKKISEELIVAINTWKELIPA